MRMMFFMAALMLLSACSLVSHEADLHPSTTGAVEEGKADTDHVDGVRGETDPNAAAAGQEPSDGQAADNHAAFTDLPNQGESIALVASQLIGTPYHFGGAAAQGFDCSGLAVYAHERAGVGIPRTAREQKRAAHPISKDSLAPGDLVFFRIGTRHVNHVGIYFGAGRFIHAPRSGEVVSYGSLEDPYYRKRFAGAGRFWSASTAARSSSPLDARGPGRASPQ